MNTPNEMSKGTSPTNSSSSFTARRSRRMLLKGAAGAAGVAVAGASILSVSPAYARFACPDNETTGQQNQLVYRTSQQTADSIVDILTVARTAE